MCLTLALPSLCVCSITTCFEYHTHSAQLTLALLGRHTHTRAPQLKVYFLPPGFLAPCFLVVHLTLCTYPSLPVSCVLHVPVTINHRPLKANGRNKVLSGRRGRGGRGQYRPHSPKSASPATMATCHAIHSMHGRRPSRHFTRDTLAPLGLVRGECWFQCCPVVPPAYWRFAHRERPCAAPRRLRRSTFSPPLSLWRALRTAPQGEDLR